MHFYGDFGYRPESLCSVDMGFPLSFRHLLLTLFKGCHRSRWGGGGGGGGAIRPFSAQQQNVLFSTDGEPIVSAILNL